MINGSEFRLAAKLFAGLVFFYLIVGIFLPEEIRNGWMAGYGLGLLAIILHFANSFFLKGRNDKQFFLFYILAMLVRLGVVLAIFIRLLLMEKFDQFSFTVSFLISYICHSVINIILLNKELTNRSG